MKNEILKKLQSNTGSTFIELLLYMSIFLILIPVLLTVSVNSMRINRSHNVEKTINSSNQFIIDRVYNIVTNAKRINVNDSFFDDAEGRLSILNQNDEPIIIALNPLSHQVEITEQGITSALSPNDFYVESMYFENIANNLGNDQIVLGVNVHINIKESAGDGILQNYITSANLKRGDYDNDGSPDYLDKFPTVPTCSGDADSDGICDESDNCVLITNTMQEDFDEDGIGNECDPSPFSEEEGGDGGGFSAYNCSSSEQIINLILEDPPLSSNLLKELLIASSPLHPDVLQELIDTHPTYLTDANFTSIFCSNTKLTDDIYNQTQNMDDLSNLSKIRIRIRQHISTIFLWIGRDADNSVDYDAEITGEEPIEGEDPPEDENNYVIFTNPETFLGYNGMLESDIFQIEVTGGSNIVNVTTTDIDYNSETITLDGEGSIVVDDNNFESILQEIINDQRYIFTISNVNNESTLRSVMFDFGPGATVTEPSYAYTTRRYAYYCEGGCSEECGDVGTGVVVDGLTDSCYRSIDRDLFPEWCATWNTTEDNNSHFSSYIGGTQEGEENLYWEKTFNTILSYSQMEKITDITISGEVAYQSTNRFFCDQYASSCVMNGTLINGQNVELYNWETETWNLVEAVIMDDTTSDQQTFEAKYTGEDSNKFIGGENNRTIMARFQFNWDGILPENRFSAPCFMMIDYFTLHLKW